MAGVLWAVWVGFRLHYRYRYRYHLSKWSRFGWVTIIILVIKFWLLLRLSYRNFSSFDIQPYLFFVLAIRQRAACASTLITHTHSRKKKTRKNRRPMHEVQPPSEPSFGLKSFLLHLLSLLQSLLYNRRVNWMRRLENWFQSKVRYVGQHSADHVRENPVCSDRGEEERIKIQ